MLKKNSILINIKIYKMFGYRYMDSQSYIKCIKENFGSFFKFEDKKMILEYEYDLYGENKTTIGRTLITNVDIIDKYETNEYLILKIFDIMNINDIRDFLERLKSLANNYIEIKKDHKLSVINAIILTDSNIEDKCVKMIKSFKYTKLYNFYLSGYSEIRIIVINFKDSSFIYNKACKKVQKVFTKIITF